MEVLRLKALMPHLGCRKISIVFNHMHQHRRRMIAGKTFVTNVLRQRQHEFADIRRELPSKASVNILRAILDAMEGFSKPRCIRTDNEPVFTSWLFRLGLRLLGIRHQRTAPLAPWQNGRVERFFKTFKELGRQWTFRSATGT